MNDFTSFSALSVAVNAPVSASRGTLALQGTGLSFVGAFGTHAAVSPAHRQICVLRQDKPSGSWHPTAIEAAGAFAFGAGYEPAVALLDRPADTEMRAARLRNAHPATVIRNRHRCRSR